jgi:mono/diheme cytochrome c family protein
MRAYLVWVLLGTLGTAGALAYGATVSDHGMGTMPMDAPAAAKPSIRTTMKKLHESPGGVPRGWKFTIPAGDPKTGREAFAKFECFKCHAVRGEQFPAAAKGADDVGPDMTGMGAHHPAEFLAQSVLDPNAVLLTDKGYTTPDGKSKMPDYTQSMTVRELIDLVAYLKSLKDGEHGHMSTGPGSSQSGAMKNMERKTEGHSMGSMGK